jgi:hypothetical protein
MWLGLRVGRVLWREDFDADRTVQALALMHTGRLLNGEGSRAASPRKAASVNGTKTGG